MEPAELRIERFADEEHDFAGGRRIDSYAAGRARLRKLEIPFSHDLSPKTRAVVNELEMCLESDLSLGVDVDQAILGIDNKDEAGLVCAEVQRLIKRYQIVKIRDSKTQKLKKTWWEMCAFVGSDTTGYIPTLFNARKAFDVEQITGSRGMITSRFELKVLGHNMAVSFKDDVTIKDIMGLVKMSNDLEDMHRQATNTPPPRLQSQHIAHSRTQDLVGTSSSKFAYLFAAKQPEDGSGKQPGDMFDAAVE